MFPLEPCLDVQCVSDSYVSCLHSTWQMPTILNSFLAITQQPLIRLQWEQNSMAMVIASVPVT